MLSKYIFNTIAYYDAMEYPMTAFEIWKYLTKINPEESSRQYSLAEVLEELEKDDVKKYLKEHRGYYFLPGREKLYAERIRRGKIACRKHRILLRGVRWMRFAPYVRMVAVTGRLSMKNTNKKSDLDLLVVFESGKIFTGRFFFTLWAHFLGIRRHGNSIANRVCLNYFITTSSLKITLKDLFASSEYLFISPVFGHETFCEFQRQNGWIQAHKPNYEMCSGLHSKLIIDSKISIAVRRLGEKILRTGKIEQLLKKWQVKKIYKNTKTHQEGSIVVANDEMLIFLPDPRGPKIYSRFIKRLKKMGEAGQYNSLEI